MYTVSDLVAAAHCEFSLLTRLLQDKGNNDFPAEKIAPPTDATPTPLVLISDDFCAQASWYQPETGAPILEKSYSGSPTAALLELALCYRELRAGGIEVSHRVALTQDGKRSYQDIHWALALLNERTALFKELVHTYLQKRLPFSWLEPPNLKRCGRCAECRAEVEAHEDMLLLEGLPLRLRNSILADYGISTIYQLAALEPVSGVLPAAVQKYKDAACLQLGWLTAEELAQGRIDDAALLAQHGWAHYDPAEDETAQALLEVTGKEEDQGASEKILLDYVAGFEAGEKLSDDDLAIAMVAAATAYHRKERSQFWLDHYHRLAAEQADWEDTRNVAVFDRIALAQPWAKDPDRPRAQPTRLLEARARLGEGSSLKEGDSGLFLMYRAPFPPHVSSDFAKNVARFAKDGEFDSVRFGAFKGTLEAIEQLDSGLYRLMVRESLPRGGAEFDQLPLALSPAQPLATRAQEEALAELAQQVGQSLDSLPESAGMDLLRRLPPRLKDGAPLPAVDSQSYGSNASIEAIHQAITLLDSSYVAVQGPPGSGKTHLGAHVIGRLIADGWKIGVVAQSHAVVENVLSGCIEKKTVRPEQVAKFKGKTKLPDAPWGEVSDLELAQALAAAPGFLIGGTAWDFSNSRKFPAGSLDLLVIDEAGQYSLANTLAVAPAARNMLLLGDPQQLPQVTQGQHDYPIDQSALGWLAAGYETLPPHLGYFLSVSWRMHPALCAAVSTLSYEGKLESAPAGSQRFLEGWEPGVYRVNIEHSGNTTSSLEEAQEVVHWAQKFLGASWRKNSDPASARPLEAEDILVVAAYNAQVDLISQQLEKAGLIRDGLGVRVGTVDKFQGQEAPVVLVSMAASSAGDSPRGAEFLLSPNRLNVALSRGQWCALVLQSSQLTNYLPGDIAGLKQLGRYLELTSSAQDLTEQE